MVYGINTSELKFHWSESCIEGHRVEYLEGALDIKLFNEFDELVIDGWSNSYLKKKGISLLRIGIFRMFIATIRKLLYV